MNGQIGDSAALFFAGSAEILTIWGLFPLSCVFEVYNTNINFFLFSLSEHFCLYHMVRIGYFPNSEHSEISCRENSLVHYL